MKTKPKTKHDSLRCALPPAETRRLRAAVRQKYPEGGTVSQFIRWAVIRGVDEVLGEPIRTSPPRNDSAVAESTGGPK